MTTMQPWDAFGHEAQSSAPRALAGGTNRAIADRFDEVGTLLEDQHANPFRVRAYRTAAARIRALDRDLAEIHAAGGLEALRGIPGIGESLSRSIRELLLHGRLPMLERLRGAADPIRLLRTLPGVGPVLAEDLHLRLGIDTLEDLESALHLGRLDSVPGIGPRRREAIRATLADRLTHAPGPRVEEPAGRPSVDELLDVDREYRERAAAGTLRRISPRRMNPGHEEWLPVLHATRGERHYTALYSNTPRAHQLHATKDWVVLYYDHEGSGGERQCTVITSRFGPLAGQRVVRGREDECLRAMHRRQWEAAIGEPLRKSG